LSYLDEYAMKTSIKVLIVDDSRTIRELFTHLLKSAEDIEVVGAAENALDAREKIKALEPDVITLDVEMPHMDGLTFLERVMSLRPLPVVMVSSLTEKGADISLRALEIGAVDVLAKMPLGASDAMAQMQQALIEKIRSASKVKFAAVQRTKDTSTNQRYVDFKPVNEPRIIAIGSSTGGVEALREVLPHLPESMPPIVIAQHMPALFTTSFAKRLNQLCKMQVSEAVHGQRLQAGNIYIAPGDFHMSVLGSLGNWRLEISQGEKVTGHRPSVDVLFASVAKAAGASACGAMLTGMGRDGAEGMLKMKHVGAYTIGQDEASCVVYGMPRAAAEIGAVAKVLPLQHMAQELVSWSAVSAQKSLRA
jgi:two-component system chemotaxis response regulator CheB